MSGRGGARRNSGPKRRLENRRVISISFDEPTLVKLAMWQRRLKLSRSEAIREVVKRTGLPSIVETQPTQPKPEPIQPMESTYDTNQD